MLSGLLNLMKNKSFYQRIIKIKLIPIIKQLNQINRKFLLDYGLKIVLTMVYNSKY